MAPRHLHYKEVYEGTQARTPGGLHKSDITRLCVKGPASAPKKYRYVSKARHQLGLERKAHGELPPGWEDFTIQKRWKRCSGSRKRRH